MVFFPSSETEIFDIISSLKNGGSVEEIPCMFLKICKPHISGILSRLFNTCLEKGIYPDIFKIARITPVFKKGARDLLENHRPISILSHLTKIFDRLIFNRILSFFARYEILSENQYGFRKNKNCELAALELVNKIMPAIENNLYCLSVFLDYKACFDTISRDILITKLERYGIRGVGLKFLKSFFINRKQYVNFGSAKSDLVNQDLGVIQGSQIGPLFFDIYCNDLMNLLREDSYILYADDTALVYVGADLKELTDHVNQKLSLISDWCKFNKLSLNPEKSEFLLVTNRKLAVHPLIKIDNKVVRKVDRARYLGILIDDHLKFHNHIELIENKLARLCGISFRLQNYFNRETALNFYYSCVYSVFNYCLTVWGGVSACTSRCDRLIRLQNRIVENLFSKYVPRYDQIFKYMEILKFNDVYRFTVSVHMFRVIKLGEFPSLDRSLNLNYPNHQYETRQSDALITPFPRIECIRMNYKYQFCSIWNDVPLYIKESPSLSIFKKVLKQRYLDSY